MNPGVALHFNRDKAAAFAAALALHGVVLYALWSYSIIPPPPEALTVFVSSFNSPAVANTTGPEAPKPSRAAPIRRETPKKAPPVTEHLPASEAPVTSPAEAAALTPPVVVAPSGPMAARSSGKSGPVNMPSSQSGDGSGPKPMHLSGELSVSCPERTAPAYPKQSMRLGEQGKTVLLVELDELGRVANIAVKTGSGFHRLDEAGVSAIKSWRCTPAKRNGVAVRSVALQTFNFIIKGR